MDYKIQSFVKLRHIPSTHGAKQFESVDNLPKITFQLRSIQKTIIWQEMICCMVDFGNTHNFPPKF